MHATDAPVPDTMPAWLQWLRNGGIGWVLGLIPLALLLWFLSLLGPVAAGEPLRLSYPWVPSLGVELSFLIDGLGLLFALIVSGIGLMIFIYAGGYMAGDAQIFRFFLYLTLFMFSMLGVVLSDNMVTLFVFWELTSITSFLLIGFKHAYDSSRYAALQALLVTGAGGLAMLAGLVLLRIAGGSWEISELVERADVIRESPLYMAILLTILLGAFTKSAQFPFHFWLPNAMAAPAPVSAYLHSATMVKAGVYLLARMHPVLGETMAWHILVTTCGALTVLLASYLSVIQVDIKRILAYTTVSGLGILVMLIGIGSEYAIEAAVVFLVVHALYKATLFMVGGTIDHESDARDIDKVGGLAPLMPFTCAAAALAALSMSGLPPFFGFVGKEAIYKAAIDTGTLGGIAVLLVLLVALVGKALTMVSAGMVAVLPFFGPRVSTPKKPHEAPPSMLVGPLVLASLGLLLGLFPGSLAEPLMNQAVGAMLGEETHIHLYLWPQKFDLVVVLSGVTIIAGAVIFYLTYYSSPYFWQRTAEPLREWVEYGPQKGYNFLVDGMQWLATWQTRFLQTGYLRYYLSIIMSTTLLLAGSALLSRVEFGRLWWPNAYIHEWIVAAVIIVGAVFTVQARSRLSAVIGLGVVGYGVAIIFILKSAPDLAMTQFAIETLSVVLFVLVVYRLPGFANVSTSLARLRDGVLASLAGALMTMLLLATTSQPAEDRLTPYFAENSYLLAHGRNVVNVILVDFRALDTMGEITVIGIGAIGIYTLMKLRPHDAPPQPPTHKEKER